MKSTFAMVKHRAALERLRRARCIMGVVERDLRKQRKGRSTDAAAALAAAQELLLQGMAYFDTPEAMGSIGT